MNPKCSENLNELAAALSQAQANFKPAPKDAKNPFFKSNYATLDSIWGSIREPLTTAGLSVTQIPVEDDKGLKLVTVLLHSSGQYISSQMYLKTAKDDMQSMGSALTYARRYALSAMVGAVTGDDDDGNEASNTNGHQPAPKKVDPRKAYTDKLKAYQATLNARDGTELSFDQSWLDTASLDELAEKGKELKKKIDEPVPTAEQKPLTELDQHLGASDATN